MEHIDPKERHLIEGCIRNERSSQERFYRQFFPPMMRMVQRYTQDQDEAMTILNNGFLRVFKKLHTYSYKGSLEGWVRRLVFHSLSDYFRSKKNKNVHFLELADRDKPIANEVYANLYFEDLVKLLDYLPPASAEVFQLYAIEGYSHAEIADRLMISQGTSKWHLSTARQKLQELLKQRNKQYHVR